MESSSTESELHARVRQQEAVADLGQRALETGDLDALLADAVDAVVQTLDTEYAAVLELLPGGDEFRLRAGAGYRNETVGTATVSADRGTQAGDTLRGEGPIVVENLGTDEQFSGSNLPFDRDVASGASVVIGSADEPWGVLGAYGTERREFTVDDARFLQSVANVLASAVENRRTRRELEEIHGRISDAFYALDDEFRYVRINERAEELLGRPADDIRGEVIWEAYPEIADSELYDHYREAMDTQEPVTFEWYSEPLDIWEEVRVYPSETGLSVYFRDITERKLTRQQLEEERDMFTQGPAVVFRWQPDAEAGWPVEYVSENVEDVLGYAREELESGDVPYSDLLLEAEIDRIAREVEENSDETTERFTHEPYRVRTKDGDVRWVKDATKIVRDESGEITHYLGYLVDITERKQRERELELFRNLLDRSSDAVIVSDPETGRILDVNDTATRQLGYSREELLDLAIPDIEIELPTLEAWESFVGDLRAEGRTTFEGTHRREHGSTFPVEVNVSYVELDREYVLSVSRDVSDRRERERELERYETIVEAINDGVYVVDDDGRFTMVNDAYADMLGYDREDLLGEHASMVVADDVVELARRTEAAMRDGDTEAPSVEAEMRTADGDRLPAEATFALLPNEDGGTHRVGVVRDVTERREREEELREKERRYEAVFEDPNILVGLLSPDGTVLDINQTAMEYIDADLEDVTGVPFWETPWWGEGDGVQNDVREWTERAAAGEYVRFEADLTRPDGERYTLEGFFRPVTNDDGEVVSIIVSDRDVTERKQRERELEESERRYRTLVENFPNGAVALVDEDICYRTVGGNPLDVADVTVDEIEGKPVADALPPALADELVPRYEAAFDGEASSFEAESNGRIYRFQVVPVRDDEGEVFAALGMSQDITEREEATRKLEESERRYRALAENFPNGGVGVYDEDLRYTLVTGTMWDDIEPDADDLEGRTIWDALPEETAADVEPIFRGALEGSTGTVVSQLGGRTYRVWATPLRDADGEISGGQSFALDITEQLDRERRLAESERRYRTLAEYFPNGIVTLFDRDLEYQLAAGQAFDDIPLEPAEVEGRHFRGVWDEETADALQRAFEAALDGEERSVEVAYEGRDWVVRVVPITDERGDVFAGMTMAQDITERKERERKLEESERRYRTLVENFPNGAVGLFDEELQYTVVGGEIIGDIEAGADDIVGLTVRERYPEEIAEQLEPNFRAALEGETNSFELEFHDRYWQAYTLPVKDDGGEIFAGMMMAQDITERLEYQRRLEESNERLEQFAYAASHDLQEPLRMVSSYLQLIEQRYEDALDSEGEEFLEFAVDGADRMREMIDGLLQYSRVETQGAPLEPVDLDAVLEEALADLQVMVEEHDAEVTAKELPRVQGDADQLRQVVQNLLSNAIEYRGDEPPRVHVSAERDGTDWLVSVRDEGIGIDPGDADRIFDVFQRLHTHGEHPGTGIGLALCERIVERHGGDIWVDSEPGEGATFTFTLPAAERSDA